MSKPSPVLDQIRALRERWFEQGQAKTAEANKPERAARKPVTKRGRKKRR